MKLLDTDYISMGCLSGAAAVMCVWICFPFSFSCTVFITFLFLQEQGDRVTLQMHAWRHIIQLEHWLPIHTTHHCSWGVFFMYSISPQGVTGSLSIEPLVFFVWAIADKSHSFEFNNEQKVCTDSLGGGVEADIFYTLIQFFPQFGTFR